MYVIKQKFTSEIKGEKNFLLKKKKLDEMSMSYIYLVKNIAIQKIHIQNARLNSLYTEKLIKYNKNWFFPPKSTK